MQLLPLCLIERIKSDAKYLERLDELHSKREKYLISLGRMHSILNTQRNYYSFITNQTYNKKHVYCEKNISNLKLYIKKCIKNIQNCDRDVEILLSKI